KRERVLRAALRGTPAPPTCRNPLPAADSLAARAPQQALAFGWSCLLGRWASAVLDGDPRAGEWLRTAEGLGGALERRRRDSSLSDAVADIHRQAGDAAATLRLARAHRDYVDGRTRYDAGLHDSATARLAQAVDGADGSPVLRDWARLFLG